MSEQESKRYHILYSGAADQQNLKSTLDKELKGTDSVVFIPCMEYYRRSEKTVKVKAIFPNYTFIYTGMDPMTLHKRIREAVGKMKMVVRELGFKEQYYGETTDTDSMTENEVVLYPTVQGREVEFLDFLRQGDGLLSMSFGYEENKKYFVMEGPLKVYEDKISDVDKHNRKAFLTFEINGSTATAGFECKPKSYWFPKGEANMVRLEDGTEIDLEELKRKVMTI